MLSRLAFGLRLAGRLREEQNPFATVRIVLDLVNVVIGRDIIGSVPK